MTAIYAGGCACGAVRYETASAPIFENHCQCIECRKRSGTGHSSYLSFAQRAEMKMEGRVTEWRVRGDSGTDKIHAFCPICGTPIYVSFTAVPEAIAVHAGSLDDPGLFRPQVVTYGIRALPWDRMDALLPVHERL